MPCYVSGMHMEGDVVGVIADILEEYSAAK